jgi:hypothetical protein
METITLGEALRWLLPFIGAGGITTILVAYFGYRGKLRPAEQQQYVKANQLADIAVNQIAEHYADRLVIDRLTQAINRLAESHDRNSDALADLARAMSSKRR